VLATLKELDLEKIVETPFGEMPGGQFIMVPITDMIVHAWDLAKATGQNTTLDAGLAELGYNGDDIADLRNRRVVTTWTEQVGS